MDRSQFSMWEMQPSPGRELAVTVTVVTAASMIVGACVALWTFTGVPTAVAVAVAAFGVVVVAQWIPRLRPVSIPRTAVAIRRSTDVALQSVEVDGDDVVATFAPARSMSAEVLDASGRVVGRCRWRPEPDDTCVAVLPSSPHLLSVLAEAAESKEVRFTAQSKLAATKQSSAMSGPAEWVAFGVGGVSYHYPH